MPLSALLVLRPANVCCHLPRTFLADDLHDASQQLLASAVHWHPQHHRAAPNAISGQ